MESQQKLLASIVATQQQQSKDMLEQFQQTMHEMMAIMFKQTMEMVKTLLPTRNPLTPDQQSKGDTQPRFHPKHHQYANILPKIQVHLGQQARNLHQRLHSFRHSGGRGGGRGSDRARLVSTSGGVIKHTQRTTPSPESDEENYWETLYNPEYEEDSHAFTQDNSPGNSTDPSGGYPSTVAPPE